MDKIKKFIDCYVPIEHCNFKCSYCYIPTLDNFKRIDRDINLEPQFIRKALSKKRLGGTCMINLCAGGETLISNKIIPIVEQLLEEGHYVMIVTNGSLTKRFEEILNFANKELYKRLFIKFSFHYLELQRLNLMNTFFENIKRMRDAKISFTLEITPSDEYIPHIKQIQEISMQKLGALPHITVARIENGEIPIMTTLTKEEYQKTWRSFNSKLFDFKMEIFNEKRKEFCYAGAWTYILDLASGDLKQCYRGKFIQNIYKNLEEPIKEKAIGCYCPEPHCFNGHALLAFGAIPNFATNVTFEDERNRKCTDKTEWLQPEMKDFMKSKLIDANNQYSDKEKQKINNINKRYNRYRKIKAELKKMLGK